MTWVLIIYLIGYNGSGTSLVRVGTYSTNAACTFQGEFWIKSQVFTDRPGVYAGGYVCIPVDAQ